MNKLRERIGDIDQKLRFYLEVKRYKAAEKLLQEALDNFGEVAILHNLRGLCFHQQSKFKEAIDSFRAAVDVNPAYTEAVINLAISYADLGDYEEAYNWYRKAQEGPNSEISTEPNTGYRGCDSLILGRIANKHVDTGSSYVLSGFLDKACDEYEKALALFPNMPDVTIALAELLIKLNQNEKAKLHLFEFDKRFPPDTRVYNLLGLIAFKEGDYITSKNRWRQSQDIQPTDSSSKAMLRCLDSMNTNQA